MIITIRIGQGQVHASSRCGWKLTRSTSEACQDDAKEFARRRPRLIGRLSGVVEKLAGSLTMTRSMELQPDNGSRSSLSIGPGFGQYDEFRREFTRRFAEGIGKLAGNTLGDHRGEDQKTYYKYVGGYRISRI
ncbi:hypothetical protein B296_00015399 [Ensete ventricosum]|uniref:Uncharacterized protein n=1 Tax=Ensete ventricosum TaxID=4639 RepID=A0A426XUG3_ENSVE|nr:hypothetical protein B296_00015399 [Ensete ventricosum]